VGYIVSRVTTTQSHKQKGTGSMKKVRFLGLDVHAETIAVAIAEPSGEVRSLGIIPNREEPIRKLVKKLGPAEQLQACYEAGPTGYVLYWQLTALGMKCEVVAPTLVPVKAGDRVKTDRRDATKLARSYRAGDLTAVWVPNEEHEALRDLVRAREVAKQDQLRARNRLSKFLLRHGRRAPAGIKAWTQRFQEWIKQQVHFEQPAQEYTLRDRRDLGDAAQRLQGLDHLLHLRWCQLYHDRGGVRRDLAI
jgi:transposase